MKPKSLTNDVSRFDVGLFIAQNSEGLRLKWSFNTDLFERDLIEGWAANYAELLSSLVADPHMAIEHLNMQSKSEQLEKADARKARKQNKLSKARFGKTKTKAADNNSDKNADNNKTT